MRENTFVDFGQIAKKKFESTCDDFKEDPNSSYVDLAFEELLEPDGRVNIHLDKIERMIEKAALSFESTNSSCSIICDNHECEKKEECFRYAIFSYLMQKGIYEYIYPLLQHQICTCFHTANKD
ncbi:MAG: hypothetical protein E6713_07940 [Sporomusaceae bacterium]|nr:hypothetical protein [Sporomusaceae bacterium]